MHVKTVLLKLPIPLIHTLCRSVLWLSRKSEKKAFKAAVAPEARRINHF